MAALAWTRDYDAKREALIRAVKLHLDRAGIATPYPHMEIHTRRLDS